MGPTADEVKGNSPAEELERANADGDDIARRDQEQARFRDEAQRGLDDIPTTDKSEVPGGPSSDAGASGRAANNSDPGEDNKGEPASSDAPKADNASGDGRGGRLQKLAAKNKKRLIKIGAGVLASIIVAVFSAFLYLSVELVHVGTDIAHFFEKRMVHTLQSREGANYKQVFAEAPKGASDTGAPIDDANHSFSMDQFKTDMNIKTIDTNAAGTVVSFTTNDGKVLHISDTTLNDPGSPLMEHLSARFPEVPFFEESATSRIIDANWGIKRKLLANADESITQDEAALTKKTEQDFAAREAATDGVAAADQSAIDKANQDLQDAATHAADAQGTGAEADAAALSPIPGAKYAVIGCATKALAQGVQKGLVIVREAQLMRVAVAILSTAAQIKRGAVHASQVGVVVKWLTGFAKSPSFRRVSSSDPTAKLSMSEQTKYSSYGGNAIASTTASLGGSSLGTVCDILNSKAGFAAIVGLDIASIFGGEETVLLKIWQATKTVASNVVQAELFSVVAKQLVGVLTDALSKPALELAAAGGTDVVDATISGADSYFNIGFMANGGQRLTAAQVADLNQAADSYDLRQAQQKGLVYQLFSPDYTGSLVSTLMNRAPTSPGELTSGVGSMVAAIDSPFNSKGLASLGSFFLNNTPRAEAYSAANDQQDPSGWGVPQFGVPDSLLQQYPDPQANERWVLTDLCKQGQTLYDSETFDANCKSASGDGSGELTDKNDSHNDAYHNFVNQCLINPDPESYLSGDCQSGGPAGFDGTPSYDHFRVYRLDLGIANMITSYNNNKNDQNDPDGNASGGAGSPGGNLPPGNAPSLAKDILANNSIVYEGTAQTDMQDAAAGKPGTCNTPLSATLLQLLDYLAKAGDSFHISALESGCQGHSGANDPHYAGRAADITQVNGDPLVQTSGSGRTTNDVKVMTELAPLMPPSSGTDWTQWSAFGQRGCGPQADPTLPNGVHQFADTCNHLHIQVSQ